MKLIVTGGAGFIGSHFILHITKKYPDYEIINIDALRHGSNLEYLKPVEKNEKYFFIKGDIADKNQMDEIFSASIDAVINFAAESHVDRSIIDSSPFIHSNVLGTQVLLDMVKKYKIPKYIQISTDEVYGYLGLNDPIKFTEKTPLSPCSPYSASKASGDLLTLAYYHTHKLPVIITRCSNNYGTHQDPEKFIPTCILSVLQNKKIPIYGDGKYVRDWIYVEDHCQGIDVVLHNGKIGEVYNIGGNNEWANVDIAKLIIEKLEASPDSIEYVKDRPGHDRRYAINSTKIFEELGWKAEKVFEEGVLETIEWYKGNYRF